MQKGGKDKRDREGIEGGTYRDKGVTIACYPSALGKLLYLESTKKMHIYFFQIRDGGIILINWRVLPRGVRLYSNRATLSQLKSYPMLAGEREGRWEQYVNRIYYSTSPILFAREKKSKDLLKMTFTRISVFILVLNTEKSEEYCFLFNIF